MTPTSLKQLREEERREEIRDALLVCSSRMSIPLYLAFWFADLIYAPEFKWAFLGLRSLILPSGWLVQRLTSRATTLLQTELICLGFTFINAFIITVMCWLTGGVTSSYYAGLNLVALGILAFFPWSLRMLPWAILSIFFPYYLFAALSGLDAQGLAALGVNSFFIAGTVVASLVKYWFTEQLRFQEIRNRMQLQREVSHREAIIAKKTAEGLKLSSLARQFSPQVVNAIRQGQLGVNTAQRPVEICAIFIDIVNSTDHVVRLEMEQIGRVLTMFMEDTMRVLLKHDVTIDKFMGDGVLAFSNAPLSQRDFVERVVNAALEVRSRIQARNVAYMDHWKTSFQIRIGIAVGRAHVGFYGNEEYFRSYTAIGPVVNLAARLCAAADPDQILVCSETAERIGDDGYSLAFAGQPDLKGFEKNSVSTYEVLAPSQTTAELPAIHMCSKGHGVLHLDSNSAGIFVLRCHECEYEFANQTPPEDEEALLAG